MCFCCTHRSRIQTQPLTCHGSAPHSHLTNGNITHEFLRSPRKSGSRLLRLLLLLVLLFLPQNSQSVDLRDSDNGRTDTSPSSPEYPYLQEDLQSLLQNTTAFFENGKLDMHSDLANEIRHALLAAYALDPRYASISQAFRFKDMWCRWDYPESLRSIITTVYRATRDLSWGVVGVDPPFLPSSRFTFPKDADLVAIVIALNRGAPLYNCVANSEKGYMTAYDAHDGCVACSL